LNIFAFEPRVFPQDRFKGIAGCKHAEYMLHRQSPAANNGLAAKNAGIDGDAFQEKLRARRGI
jgi:hypothetical protein